MMRDVCKGGPNKPTTAATATTDRRLVAADPEVAANAKEGLKYFQAGIAAAKRGDWRSAEDDFSVAAARFRSAKMPNNAETAASNSRLAEKKQLRAGNSYTARRAAPSISERSAAQMNKLSKEECGEGLVHIVNLMAPLNYNDPVRKQLSDERKKLAKRCE